MLSSTRQAAEEARLLIGACKTHSGPGPRRLAGDIAAEELDRPRGGGNITRDDVEERRLPGPVGAQDRPTLSGRDVEVDVSYRMKSAKPPADPPQAEGRLGVLGCFHLGQTAT